MSRHRRLTPLADRGPLRVMFVNTSLPIGGAETLQRDLVRSLDRNRFLPEICCLKERGPIGDELSQELPVFSGLTNSKYDVTIWRRLTKLFQERKIDAIVTVGAGDKMFWGRLAARSAGVSVVISALHATGWPDRIGRLNRCLTGLTDAFVGVARSHGRHLVIRERFPAEKVHVIPNGVDLERFQAHRPASAIRASLRIADDAPVAGIVAKLRPEKHHELFLRVAAMTRIHMPKARFLIVGDGPERPSLESIIRRWGLDDSVLLLGDRSDVPELLSAMDVVLLTSHIEANPVSVLEAMAAGKPVLATRVGSLEDVIENGENGYLTESGDAEKMTNRLLSLFQDGDRARTMGLVARRWVEQNASLQRMVSGYEELISRIYESKAGGTSLDRLDADPSVRENHDLERDALTLANAETD